MVALMQQLLQDTLDHVRTRQQFGVPLASFQVVAHRLADMHLVLVQAEALVYAAPAQIDRPAAPSEAAAAGIQAAVAGFQAAVPGFQAAVAGFQAAVAAAQVAVARACRTVSQGAVQLHGGMGMTDELRVGHAFKRLTLIERRAAASMPSCPGWCC